MGLDDTKFLLLEFVMFENFQVNPKSDADELKDHFTIFGPVRRALIFLVKQAGFAQVEFVNEISVFRAMQLSGTTYKGFYIRVRQNNLVALYENY